jgi:ADP-heptose:LPS heptosyltransferase
MLKKFFEKIIQIFGDLISGFIEFGKSVLTAFWQLLKLIIKESIDFLKDFSSLVKKIFVELFFPKKGIIEFTTGKHEIFIKVKTIRHRKVWIHICDSDEHPGCSYLDRDMFSVSELFAHGFVLVADIKSKKRKIFWYIK